MSRCFCLVLFRKSGDSQTPQKLLACLALIGLSYVLLDDSMIEAVKPVFWLETLMRWAFGTSWFVKGETLWKDTGVTR